jgi:hypothetical protein
MRDELLLFYILTIGISLYTIFAVPKVPGVSERVASFRQSAIIIGFLPCFYLALIAQVILLGLYMWRSREVAEGATRFENLLPTSFEDSPRASSSSTQASSKSATSDKDNPFL